jgi:hypothetical protein
VQAVTPSGGLLPCVVQQQFFQSGIKPFDSRRPRHRLIRAAPASEVGQDGFRGFLKLAPHPFQNTCRNAVWIVAGSGETGKSVKKDKAFAPWKILPQK